MNKAQTILEFTMLISIALVIFILIFVIYFNLRKDIYEDKLINEMNGIASDIRKQLILAYKMPDGYSNRLIIREIKECDYHIYYNYSYIWLECNKYQSKKYKVPNIIGFFDNFNKSNNYIYKRNGKLYLNLK